MRQRKNAPILITFGPFACQNQHRFCGVAHETAESDHFVPPASTCARHCAWLGEKAGQAACGIQPSATFYVQAVDGEEFDPRLKPEDLRAIGDVERAMHCWTRYVLTTQHNQADLIFVVRKGRLAELGVSGQVGVGGRAGSGPGGQAGSGPTQVGSGPTGAPSRTPNDSGRGYGGTVGGEGGPRDDLLEVYQPNPNDPPGTLLWQHTRADGLNAPKLVLFKQLKDEVERTYPSQSARKSPKP